MNRAKNKTEELSTRHYLIAAAISLALSFALFGNGIKGDFVYDDTWVIERNPTIQDASAVFRQFILPYHYLQPETGLYRPLTAVSFTFNSLLGKSPASYHILNILLHALNVFLVFLFVWRLTRKKTIAILSAVLFMTLPIHVESVTSIVGRAELLSFALSMLTLLFFQGKRYWLSSLCFLLAMLSKESAFALVPLLAWWIWIYERTTARATVTRLLYFVPAGLIYVGLRAIALREYFLSNDASLMYNPLKFTDALTRFLTASKILMLYLWKTIVPIRLAADYSYHQISLDRGVSLLGFVGILIILGSLAIIVHKKYRTTFVGFSIALGFFSFLIISNLIFPIGTIMAERTWYLPSLGISMLGAAGFERLMRWRWKTLWWVVVGCVAIIYGGRSIQRNAVWLNSETFLRTMVADSPRSLHAKNNLGNHLIKSGRWEEGKRLLMESYASFPDHAPLLDALGIVAEHERRYEDAERFYIRALQVRPHYATSFSNLGRMYFQLQRYDLAAQLYWGEFQYHARPDFMLIYAMSMSKLGRFDDAISTVTRYYGEHPQDEKLQFALGYAYYKKGDKIKAQEYFKNSKNPAISDEDFIKSIEKF